MKLTIEIPENLERFFHKKLDYLVLKRVVRESLITQSREFEKESMTHKFLFELSQSTMRVEK